MNRYSKYIPVKSAIENLFGKKAWYALKESNSVPTWKKYAEKTLKAIRVSIHQTVKHCDNEWLCEIDEKIDRGLAQAKNCKEIDELIAVLAGTLINVSFLQVGYMPHRSGSNKNFTLRKENWDFNLHRNVVYLQSHEQKENYFWGKQQRKIGFEEQLKIHQEYKASGSNISYSEWCEKNTKA
ncbi:MAG: hypothetical protein ACI8VC_002584 [Candidatus Endobugula sp.]|jgi:hypothetical protein